MATLTQNQIGVKYLNISLIQGKIFYRYVLSMKYGKQTKKSQAIRMYAVEVGIIKKRFWLAYNIPNLFEHDQLIREEKRCQQLLALS